MFYYAELLINNLLYMNKYQVFSIETSFDVFDLLLKLETLIFFKNVVVNLYFKVHGTKW